MNERITEKLTRTILEDAGYTEGNGFIVEEQQTSDKEIKKLFRVASKNQSGHNGYPEFIIRHKEFKKEVIIVECKADVNKHESLNNDSPIDFSVDGVIHYSQFLKDKFNVIAIAISGQNKKELKISSYIFVLGKQREAGSSVLSFQDYRNKIYYGEDIMASSKTDLIGFAKDLHNDMRDYAKLSEQEKPLLVAGILIALQNNSFSKGYRQYQSGEELAKEILNAIEKEFRKSKKISKDEIDSVLQPFTYISTHPELTRGSINDDQILYRIVCDIDEKVRPFLDIYKNFDVVGQFYGEFLKYSGGDKKGLGIVLTPHHITELFADLAQLNTNSVVFDPCCGTAGFLIAAAHKMCSMANGNSQPIIDIRESALIGTEQQPMMYALGVSNMMLRGDGYHNVFRGSCFDQLILDKVKKLKPTVGMINPPYSQKVSGLSELDFVLNMLDCLQPNGIGLAIVPMSCAIQSSVLKEKIMDKHTLLAAMSMPDQLFYPVGTNTIILVFKAHQPHDKSIESWFGYWKDDGFEITRTDGRSDKHSKWQKIESKWLDTYLNKKVIAGKSAKAKVSSKDEWCPEAYLEIKYDEIDEKQFEDQIKKYLIYKELIQ